MKPLRIVGWLCISVAAVALSRISTAVADPAASRMVGTVRVELSIDKAVYAVGEPVAITLALANVGSEAASFQFNTGQMYDFVLLREGLVVWRWSQGRAFTQALTALTLRPGETRTFQERWNQRNAQGRQIPDGSYELVAVFPATARPGAPVFPESPRVSFQIGLGMGKPSAGSPSVTNRAVEIDGRFVSEVLINGRPVLRIRSAAGGYSPQRRAEIVSGRLAAMLIQGLRSEELRVRLIGSEVVIAWRDRLIVTADRAHARLNATTPGDLAVRWLQEVRQALSRS